MAERKKEGFFHLVTIIPSSHYFVERRKALIFLHTQLLSELTFASALELIGPAGLVSMTSLINM